MFSSISTFSQLTFELKSRKMSWNPVTVLRQPCILKRLQTSWIKPACLRTASGTRTLLLHKRNLPWHTCKPYRLTGLIRTICMSAGWTVGICYCWTYGRNLLLEPPPYQVFRSSISGRTAPLQGRPSSPSLARTLEASWNAFVINAGFVDTSDCAGLLFHDYGTHVRY